MVLEFNPPTDLINAYLNRPSPGQIASQGIQQALQSYAAEKDAKQKKALAKQQRDTATFAAVAPYAEEAAIPGLAKNYGITIPTAGAVPPTPSTGTAPSPTAGMPDAQGNPVTEAPAPSVSPLIQASAQAHNFNPLGVPIPTSKVGLAKYIQNQTIQKNQKEIDAPPKAEDKYYTTAQATSLLKSNPEASKVIASFPKDQVPRDAVHLMMGQSKSDASGDNKSFIGNDAQGNPLFADKRGNISNGTVPSGGGVLPKTSTMPTAATRTSGEFADTIIPHIQQMRDLVQQADAKGYIGPTAGRVYGQFLAGKVGSTGNPEADQLLGRLRATDSLLKTGAMKVHFGARGGSQMYDHFSDLLNSGKQSAAMLNGSLDGIESFMQGYANAGKPGGSFSVPPPNSALVHLSTKDLQAMRKKMTEHLPDGN